jgi:protein tyrosine/serine phosphatase
VIRTAIVLSALSATAVGVLTWATVESRQNRLVWDHFDVVKHGVLYRSGQLLPEQLRAAVERYGIRTVISFQYPGDIVESERATARALGIDFMNLPMTGDGFGKESQFREVLKATDDPDRRPVLVHCARGTCRTGSAVALYRFERDGWTIDDVSAEMKRQSYRDGWIPGYIYNMVSNRPGQERFVVPVLHDENLPKAELPPASHPDELAKHPGKEAADVHIK